MKQTIKLCTVCHKFPKVSKIGNEYHCYCKCQETGGLKDRKSAINEWNLRINMQQCFGVIYKNEER